MRPRYSRYSSATANAQLLTVLLAVPLLVGAASPSEPLVVGEAAHGADGFTALQDPLATGVFYVWDSEGLATPYAVVATHDYDTDEDTLTIVSLAEPANPVQTAVIERSNFVGLVHWLTTFQGSGSLSGNNYVIVTSYDAEEGSGFSILQLFPDRAEHLATQLDGTSGFDLIGDIHGVAHFAVSGVDYAIFTSFDRDSDSGTAITIADLANPGAPTVAATVEAAALGSAGFGSQVKIFESSTTNYAITFTTIGDDKCGFTIVNLADPRNPTVAASISGGSNGFDWIDGSNKRCPYGNLEGLSTFVSGGTTYAAVGSLHSGTFEAAVTIINLADPTNPTQASVMNPSTMGFDIGYGLYEFEPFTSDSGITYALICGYTSADVTIFNLADPTNPTVASIIVSTGSPRAVSTFAAGGKAYAVGVDHTGDAIFTVDMGPAAGYQIDGVCLVRSGVCPSTNERCQNERCQTEASSNEASSMGAPPPLESPPTQTATQTSSCSSCASAVFEAFRQTEAQAKKDGACPSTATTSSDGKKCRMVVDGRNWNFALD